MVRNALGKVDVKSGASSFAELSEADQKELRLLAESDTRAYSQRHGTETIALTKGLGDLITGNAAISANGIGSLYFDYVARTTTGSRRHSTPASSSLPMSERHTSTAIPLRCAS